MAERCIVTRTNWVEVKHEPATEPPPRATPSPKREKARREESRRREKAQKCVVRSPDESSQQTQTDVVQAQFAKISALTAETEQLSSRVMAMAAELQDAKDLIATLKKEKREMRERYRSAELEEELRALRAALTEAGRQRARAAELLAEQDRVVATLRQEAALKDAAEARQVALEAENCRLQCRAVQLEAAREQLRRLRDAAKVPPLGPVAAAGDGVVLDSEGQSHRFRESLLSSDSGPAVPAKVTARAPGCYSFLRSWCAPGKG